MSLPEPDALVAALAKTVFDGAGHSTPALRRAVGGKGGDVPADLASVVDKIRRHAYKITDQDIAGLKAAGYGEDELFELTIATALGTAVKRLELALAAVDGISGPSGAKEG